MYKLLIKIIQQNGRTLRRQCACRLVALRSANNSVKAAAQQQCSGEARGRMGGPAPTCL